MGYVNFDEELKRRQAQARAKGMDENSIAKFTLIDKVMNQRQAGTAQPKVQAQAPTAKKQPSGWKKFAVNTGALVASLGAGALSAAAAPVTGGASLVGGFAAGAGIEALRRKLLGEEQNLGASALEGGLTIIPGVGKLASKGLKLAKGAKIASEGVDIAKGAKVAKGAMVEKEALKNSILSKVKATGKNLVSTPEEGALSSRLTKAGGKIRAEQRGITVGERLTSKSKVLDEARATELNKAVSGANKGFKSNDIRGQVSNVQKSRSAVLAERDTLLSNSKAKVTPEVSKIGEDIVVKGRGKVLKFDPSNASHAKINNQYASKLASAKTPQEVLDARQTFDKTARSVFTNASTEQTVDKELAAVYRDAADKMLAKLEPGVKSFDKQISTFSDAEKFLTNSKSKLNPSGIKPAGTSINGKGFGGGTQQKIVEGAGKALETTAKVTSSPFTKAGVQQAVGRSLTKPYLAEPLPADPAQAFTPPTEAPVENDIVSQLAQSEIQDPQQLFDALTMMEQPQEQAPTPRSEQYMQMADQAIQAGDAKSAKSFMDFAKVAADMEATANPKAKGLNSTASGVIADTKTGLNSLQNLATQISESGANNPIIGFARSKNPFDTEAQKLQSNVAIAKQIVGKALEGGVLRKEDEVKYAKILPNLNDTDVVAQYKIQSLIDLISQRLQEYELNIGGGSGGIELTDFNQQEQGAY